MKSLTMATLSGLIAFGCATQHNTDSRTKQGLGPNNQDDSLVYKGMIGSDLTNVMGEEQVSDVLSGKMIKDISISKEFAGTTTLYTINLSYQGSDLGLEGPQGVPCYAAIKAEAIGGVVTTEPPRVTEVETLCAAAQTFPTPAGVPGGIIENPDDVTIQNYGIIYDSFIAMMKTDTVAEKISDELLLTMESVFIIEEDRINYNVGITIAGSDLGLQGPQSVPCFINIQAHVLSSNDNDNIEIDSAERMCAAAISGPLGQ